MTRFFLCLLYLILASACTYNKQAHNQTEVPPEVAFHWFEYRGNDPIFSSEVPQDHYQNPILAGFYPDPSIVRVKDSYYMVHSSFLYFPGLPIFHSKDLVNWELIGHGLHNQKQLSFNSQHGMSRGIYAPTIRFHDGLYYIITTDVDGIGNFYITAQNPAGPWSKPVTLPEINGIDPDIFFDDSGKVYIAHNGPPDGEPLYQGHRAIWLWEYDLEQKKVLPESGRVIVNGGADITQKPIWIEAPHIYKKNGWYYLSCAEGGTSVDHSQVVFRTRKLSEPFVPYKNNPILTQRDLPKNRANPITSAGHADFVQTPSGEWWAVFLAIRPYAGAFHNTGRETYMLPVHWANEWPHILDKKAEIPYVHKAPKHTTKPIEETTPTTGNFTWRDDFDSRELDLNWVMVRSNNKPWHSLKDHRLLVKPRAIALADKGQPSYLGRRQQHSNYSATTEFTLPKQENVLAGLAAFQNSSYNYFFGVVLKDGKYTLTLEKNVNGELTVLPPVPIENVSESLALGIEQNKSKLNFFMLNKDGVKSYVFKGADASTLSTQVAGGFIGVTIGPHVRHLPGQNR